VCDLDAATTRSPISSGACVLSPGLKLDHQSPRTTLSCIEQDFAHSLRKLVMAAWTLRLRGGGAPIQLSLPAAGTTTLCELRKLVGATAQEDVATLVIRAGFPPRELSSDGGEDVIIAGVCAPSRSLLRANHTVLALVWVCMCHASCQCASICQCHSLACLYFQQCGGLLMCLRQCCSIHHSNTSCKEAPLLFLPFHSPVLHPAFCPPPLTFKNFSFFPCIGLVQHLESQIWTR